MILGRLLIVVVIILAANGLAVSASGPGAATRVSGEAYGLAVGQPPQPAGGSPYVTLPPEGGSVSDSSPGTGLGFGGTVGSLDQLTATTSGSLSGEDGRVNSVATLGFVELFTGIVRASDVRVVASSSVDGGRASSSGNASFGNLSVAGLAYPNPRPNERVELPGLGYVILNEQLVGGDGHSSSSIVVRAIHLHVSAPGVLDVPRDTDFVVGAASSGVPDINASNPVPSGPRPTATPVPWAPISSRAPIDISIGNGNHHHGNGNFSFNGNANRSRTPTSTATTVRAPGTPLVITVVVVIVTNTPVPTATSTTGVAPKP